MATDVRIGMSVRLRNEALYRVGLVVARDYRYNPSVRVQWEDGSFSWHGPRSLEGAGRKAVLS